MSKYTSGAREPYMSGDADSLPYSTKSISIGDSTESYSDADDLTHEECVAIFAEQCDNWLSLNAPALLKTNSKSQPVAIKNEGPRTPFKKPSNQKFFNKK